MKSAIGPAVLVVVALVFFVCAIRAMPSDLFASLTAPVVVVGLVVVVLAVLAVCTVGRSATGHFHGGGMSHLRATHEAGHYVAGRAVGASTVIRSDGDVDAYGLPNAKAQIVFLLAGRYAAGSGAGCAGDDGSIRRALSEYPPEQRSAVMAAARREARRIVSSRRGEIQRVAKRLTD